MGHSRSQQHRLKIQSCTWLTADLSNTGWRSNSYTCITGDLSTPLLPCGGGSKENREGLLEWRQICIQCWTIRWRTLESTCFPGFSADTVSVSIAYGRPPDANWICFKRSQFTLLGWVCTVLEGSVGRVWKTTYSPFLWFLMVIYHGRKQRNHLKQTQDMSESASFKFWGIDTRYKASLLCDVSHTADTTPFVFLAEERLHSLPLSWQIRGFPAPGLRKLSWDTPEVLAHEETFEDKTGAMAMEILRGDVLWKASWLACSNSLIGKMLENGWLANSGLGKPAGPFHIKNVSLWAPGLWLILVLGGVLWRHRLSMVVAVDFRYR